MTKYKNRKPKGNRFMPDLGEMPVAIVKDGNSEDVVITSEIPEIVKSEEKKVKVKAVKNENLESSGSEGNKSEVKYTVRFLKAVEAHEDMVCFKEVKCDIAYRAFYGDKYEVVLQWLDSKTGFVERESRIIPESGVWCEIEWKHEVVEAASE